MIVKQTAKNPSAIPQGRKPRQSRREEVAEPVQTPQEEAAGTLPPRKARSPQQRAAMLAALKGA